MKKADSDAGAFFVTIQPMISHDGRYVMILNGEVYNYKDLKHKLFGEGKVFGFGGHSNGEPLCTLILFYISNLVQIL